VEEELLVLVSRSSKEPRADMISCILDEKADLVEQGVRDSLKRGRDAWG
jgi:hypothetical protein